VVGEVGDGFALAMSWINWRRLCRGGMCSGWGQWLLDRAVRHVPPIPDITADLDNRLAVAEELIDEGARFVHVHTKTTDEAGHSKQPRAKLDVLNAVDPGLARLTRLAGRAIVAVTGDHATPSIDGVLHTADPTPLLIAGPTVRPDAVMEFGEAPAHAGWFGAVRAADVLPLLFGYANRPAFLGHRATPSPCLALPDNPEPMRISTNRHLTADSGDPAGDTGV